MSKSKALDWLIQHNGDGAWARSGKGGTMLLAAGQVAPYTRVTFNKLRDAGLVEYYGGKSNRARCRITDKGREAQRTRAKK